MPEGLNLQIIVAGNAIPVLHRAAVTMPEKLRRIVGQAGQIIRREAAINVRQKLNVSDTRTGALGRSITVIIKGPTRAVVGPTMIYGAIHEFGGTIRAKTKPYLVFQYPKGSWHSVKSVNIPARPYMRPGLETAQPKVEKTISEMLGSLFGPTLVMTEID